MSADDNLLVKKKSQESIKVMVTMNWQNQCGPDNNLWLPWLPPQNEIAIHFFFKEDQRISFVLAHVSIDSFSRAERENNKVMIVQASIWATNNLNYVAIINM